MIHHVRACAIKGQKSATSAKLHIKSERYIPWLLLSQPLISRPQQHLSFRVYMLSCNKIGPTYINTVDVKTRPSLRLVQYHRQFHRRRKSLLRGAIYEKVAPRLLQAGKCFLFLYIDCGTLKSIRFYNIILLKKYQFTIIVYFVVVVQGSKVYNSKIKPLVSR